MDIDKRQPREAVSDVVAYGRGQMPPFTSLPEGVRKDIVAYLFGDMPKEAPKVSDDVPTDIPYIFGGYTRLLDDKGLPGCRAAVGDADCGRCRRRDDQVAGHAGRSSGGAAAEGSADGHRELRRTGHHGRRRAVHRRDQRREVPRLRHADGKKLWEASLPAGGYATPATYVVDGRQYVVIAAGGGKMGTKSGDTYVAYALPETGRAPSRPRPSSR